MRMIGRRALLTASAALMAAGASRAEVITGSLPWAPDTADPPAPVRPGPWAFFTPEEGAAVEALVDRLIPPDDAPGGRDAGCAVFIDRQLAGGYGHRRGWYMRPPFQEALPTQGVQSPITPAARYRMSLAALDAYCRAAYAGKAFAQLDPDQQDKILHGLEDSSLQLKGASGRAFFELLLKDTKEGFFADPVYGGNRDMCAWKMIGFPGARYDYRDWIGRYNEVYPYPPVGIGAHPDWKL